MKTQMIKLIYKTLIRNDYNNQYYFKDGRKIPYKLHTKIWKFKIDAIIEKE